MNSFAVTGECGQFFADCLIFVESGLFDIEKCGSDDHVRNITQTHHKRISTVTVKRGADKRRRFGVAIKKHIFPRNQNIIKHQQSIDFIKTVGQRIIFDRQASGESAPANVFESGSTHIANKTDRIIRKFFVSGPSGNGRFDKSLIGIGRRRFKFCTAHNDPCIGFFDDVQ